MWAIIKKTSPILIIYLILDLVFCYKLYAKDLGIHGPVFKIKEESILSQINNRLQIAKKEGRIKKLQEDMRKKTLARLNYPKPVAGITKAKEDRTWIYDPSITLDHDLKDQNGRVFYKSGTRVNPLNYISLTKALIFIDGDDNAQLNWALKQSQKTRSKIILVRGAIIDLMRKTKVRLYFDQNATLTGKFNITHVPAIIQQVETIKDNKSIKALRISEVSI